MSCTIAVPSTTVVIAPSIGEKTVVACNGRAEPDEELLVVRGRETSSQSDEGKTEFFGALVDVTTSRALWDHIPVAIMHDPKMGRHYEALPALRFVRTHHHVLRSFSLASI
jgi:hypothetical protein